MVEQRDKISFWKLVFLTLRRPREAFAYISEKPSFWPPLLLRLIVIILFAALSSSVSARMAIEQMQARGASMPAAQLEQAKLFIESPIFSVIGIFSAIFTTIIVWLIMAAIFTLFGSLWGERKEFKISLSMVAFSWIPLVIHNILASIFVATTGKMIRPGLSSLLSIETLYQPTFLSNMLKYVDVFSIWSIVLLIIGLSTIFKISKGRSSIIVLGYFGITILINGSMALLQSLASAG